VAGPWLILLVMAAVPGREVSVAEPWLIQLVMVSVPGKQISVAGLWLIQLVSVALFRHQHDDNRFQDPLQYCAM